MTNMNVSGKASGTWSCHVKSINEIMFWLKKRFTVKVSPFGFLLPHDEKRERRKKKPKGETFTVLKI